MLTKSHMDNKKWDIKHYNTLEKLVHSLHMDEIWTKTKLHYDHLREQNIWMMDKVLCKCVNDIENNGIVNLLHFLNLKIRYPGLTSQKLTKMKYGHIYNLTPCIYRYSFFVSLSPELLNFNFTQDVEDNLKRAYGVLVDDDKGMKHYQWKLWKKSMKSITRQDVYELAMFLYCTLNSELEYEFENRHFHYEFKDHK